MLCNTVDGQFFSKEKSAVNVPEKILNAVNLSNALITAQYLFCMTYLIALSTFQKPNMAFQLKKFKLYQWCCMVRWKPGDQGLSPSTCASLNVQAGAVVNGPFLLKANIGKDKLCKALALHVSC
jgi:hypothetical protein